MTWQYFLMTYAVVTVLASLIARRHLAGKGVRLARTVVGVSSALVVYDSAAEQLNLWAFPRLLGVSALGVPVENAIFALLTCTNIVFIYVLLGAFVRSRTD